MRLSMPLPVQFTVFWLCLTIFYIFVQMTISIFAVLELVSNPGGATQVSLDHPASIFLLVLILVSSMPILWVGV